MLMFDDDIARLAVRSNTAHFGGAAAMSVVGHVSAVLAGPKIVPDVGSRSGCWCCDNRVSDRLRACRA